MRNLIIFLTLLFATHLSAADRQVDFHKLVDEGTYYGVYVGREKIGYFVIKGEIITENAKVYFSNSMNLHIDTFIVDSVVSSISIEIQYLFDIKNRNLVESRTKTVERIFPNLSHFERDLPKETNKEELTANYIKNNQYKILTSTNLEKTEKVVNLPILLADDFYATEYLAQNNSKVGRTIQIEVSDLDFEEEKITPAKIKIVNKHSYINQGEEFVHYEFEVVEPDQTYKFLLDNFGKIISGYIAGMEIKIEPKDVAKSNKTDRHIASLGTLKINKRIASEDAINEIYLKLTGAGLVNNFIANMRQEVIKETTESKFVRLKRGGEHSNPNADINLKDYLEATPRFNWENNLLKSINPYSEISNLSSVNKVKFLLEFTHKYIDYDFTLAATLEEIIENKKGDCTEYAQLFITLARLNGIPAREVSGFAYGYDENDPKFYGHAWAEVWLDGNWKEVDPGWNEFNVDASHIQLMENYSYSFEDRIEVISYR